MSLHVDAEDGGGAENVLVLKSVGGVVVQFLVPRAARARDDGLVLLLANYHVADDLVAVKVHVLDSVSYVVSENLAHVGADLGRVAELAQLVLQ